MKPRRACFLDRDGVLNEIVMRGTVVSSPWTLDEFRLLPGAEKLVAAVLAAGLIPIVITNQPDLARGNLAPAELEKMHDVLRTRLQIREIEVCGSGDDADPRRKPNPGMIFDAARRLGVDIVTSLLVGDSLKDLEAARRAGVPSVLLETSYNTAAHGRGDSNARSHREVVDLIAAACHKDA